MSDTPVYLDADWIIKRLKDADDNVQSWLKEDGPGHAGDEPTMEKNGYVVDRDEQVTVSMGLLNDVLNLLSDTDEITNCNSISTPDCFVELAAIVMKVNR